MSIRNRDDSSPKQRGGFIRSVADFQTELFRVSAGYLPGVPRWILRRKCAEMIFRDARRVQDLYLRCKELGAAQGGRHLSEGVAGRKLIEHLCLAPDSNQAFRALFLHVKPALIGLLKDYLRADLRVFDAPSVPVVEADIDELERQVAWAKDQPEAEAALEEAFGQTLDELVSQLETWLKEGSDRSVKPLRKGRKIGRLPLMQSVLPDGFKESVALRPELDETKYEERELFHAHNFLMEVQAADSCASLLFEAPDMPWEFCFDVARHMWDESRHCEFGELKLTAMGHDIREIGLSNTAYVLRQTIDPLDRYAALTTQEADAFPIKHAGLKDAIQHGDELSARAWSYDISDETQHVRYGHKWIPVMIEETLEPRSYDEIKRDAENWRRDVLGAAYATAGQQFASNGSRKS